MPVAFGWLLALYPLRIVLFELVIDPASIVFEAEEGHENLMRQPPRDPDEPLFSVNTVLGSLRQGIAVLVAVAAVYGWALAHDTPETARAVAFVTIVLGNLGPIDVNRSSSRSIVQTLRSPNRAPWWVAAGTLAGMAMAFCLAREARVFMRRRWRPAHWRLCGRDLRVARRFRHRPGAAPGMLCARA